MVTQAGTHASLIGIPGPYRDLMGPQVAERRTQEPELLEIEAPQAETARETGAVVTSLSEDAATVSWPDTIRTLMRVVTPYRRQLGVVVGCGIGRVLAFIGVGVFGALIIAAVRNHLPTETLVLALLITAPLAGVLHWLESWIAHAMAYALLAEMRIDLFRKLDALAPAYLLRRRSGDLVALATQDVETVEYFFAHTIAPAIVAGLVPSLILLALAWIAWPLALVLAPFLLYAGASPVLGRQADRHALAPPPAARWARWGRMPPRPSRAWPNWSLFDATGRRRDGFIASVRGLPAAAAAAAGRSVVPGRGAGGGDRSRRPGGRRLWVPVLVSARQDRADHAAAAGADLGRRVPAGVRNRPGRDGNWPTRSPRPAGCMWCTPNRC